MSSLREVLTKVPELLPAIDGMNEIAPGVSSSPTNLGALLSALLEARALYETSTDAAVLVEVIGRKDRRIHVTLEGPEEAWTANGQTHTERADVAAERFPCTEEGLLHALIYAKGTLRRLRREGVCPDCCAPRGERPRKRLKLEHMGKCLRCLFRAAVDMPARNRA